MRRIWDRYWISLILPVFLMVMLTLTLPVNYLAAEPSPQWLQGRRFRIQVTIKEVSGRTLESYQLRIRIPPDLISGTGQDVIVTSSDGITLLPSWVEEWSADGGIVWVKLPRIMAGQTETIFIYWGGPPATGDPREVFLFYDDFEDYDIGTHPSAWTPIFTSTKAYVSDERAFHGAKSFYMRGGWNGWPWVSVAPVSEEDNMCYHFALYPLTPSLRGGSYSAGFFERRGNRLYSWIRVYFRHVNGDFYGITPNECYDGNAVLSGLKEAGECDRKGLLVRGWTVNRWYEVEVCWSHEKGISLGYINGKLVMQWKDPKLAPRTAKFGLEATGVNYPEGFFDYVWVRRFTYPEPMIKLGQVEERLSSSTSTSITTQMPTSAQGTTMTPGRGSNPLSFLLNQGLLELVSLVVAVGSSVGAFLVKRMRKSQLQRLLDKVDKVYWENRGDATRCETALISLRDELVGMLKEGKVSEEVYELVVDRIEQRLDECRRTLGRASRPPRE